ncbi:FlgO family outer membrane protein [Roseospira goensis]|uniref:TolB-like protein n=1 Tax=Roseospira goensis TaxID=391922 RepID=A0A7W6RXZ9_9PROT|nr:FlgO family outer membrane protein [Roseospira goensis]MBB4284649.1 TolB-like protein [Roseospira goensis]
MSPLLRPLLIIPALLLAACAEDPRPASTLTEPEAGRPAVDIELASYAAADQLMEFSRAPLNPDKPIVVTTLVSGSDLRTSSPLGRLVSEQVATRLANAGFTVRELRFGTAFKAREGTGELVLSRDMRDLSRSVGAQAVVAGTYTPARTRVFINAKLIQASTGDVLSAVDFELPRSDDLETLTPMPASGFNATRYDRHPVSAY